MPWTGSLASFSKMDDSSAGCAAGRGRGAPPNVTPAAPGGPPPAFAIFQHRRCCHFSSPLNRGGGKSWAYKGRFFTRPVSAPHAISLVESAASAALAPVSFEWPLLPDVIRSPWQALSCTRLPLLRHECNDPGQHWVPHVRQGPCRRVAWQEGRWFPPASFHSASQPEIVVFLPPDGFRSSAVEFGSQNRFK